MSLFVARSAYPSFWGLETSIKKKLWGNSLPIDMLLYDVSLLVVAQPSSEVPEGLMNYPVHLFQLLYMFRETACPSSG